MTKKVIIDQMQRSVELTFPLKRIVSLVPSQIKLLHYFGLEKEVVAITKFLFIQRIGMLRNNELEGLRN